MLEYILLGALAFAAQMSTYFFIRNVFFSHAIIKRYTAILMMDIPGTSPAVKDPYEAFLRAKMHNMKMKLFWWFWAALSWSGLVGLLLFRGLPG